MRVPRGNRSRSPSHRAPTRSSPPRVTIATDRIRGPASAESGSPAASTAGPVESAPYPRSAAHTRSPTNEAVTHSSRVGKADTPCSDPNTVCRRLVGKSVPPPQYRPARRRLVGKQEPPPAYRSAFRSLGADGILRCASPPGGSPGGCLGLGADGNFGTDISDSGSPLVVTSRDVSFRRTFGADGNSRTVGSDGASAHALAAASSAVADGALRVPGVRDGSLDTRSPDARPSKRSRLGSLLDLSSATGQVPPPSSLEADLGGSATLPGVGEGVPQGTLRVSPFAECVAPVPIGSDGILRTHGEAPPRVPAGSAPLNRRNRIRLCAQEAALGALSKKARLAAAAALQDRPGSPRPPVSVDPPPSQPGSSCDLPQASSGSLGPAVLPLQPSLAPRGPPAPRGPSAQVSVEWLRAHPELGWLRSNVKGPKGSTSRS